ncbi:hypothetical protein [Catellatospora sp. NPDC049609]|uniref:hypothetical protein n=1 Tax=Catellatospora sp. NPDC049609 TaxID=3155505 RepID=UPI003429264A
MSTEVTRSYKPNLVLVNYRKSVGWESRKRAARELLRVGAQNGLKDTPTVEAIEKAMYRHETGRVAVTDPIYRRLYCLAYGATPHELFGEIESAYVTDGTHFTVRSHKFIPAYVTPGGINLLSKTVEMRICDDQWQHCLTAEVDHPEGECTVYAWPHGSVVFHLVEELKFSTIASLAAWRKVSYDDNRKWAEDFIRVAIASFDASDLYILGAHWVTESAWPAEQLEAALRIMASPAVLLHRDRKIDNEHLAHAELIEQSLIADGYDNADIEPFGVRGISSGFASWSGVVYHPIAPERSLREKELVACELAVQSMWCMTRWVARCIEQGFDPDLPPEFGWRYLRGVRSRLTLSLPRETGQHQTMRRAILRTSDLMPALDQAIETLRDAIRE